MTFATARGTPRCSAKFRPPDLFFCFLLFVFLETNASLVPADLIERPLGAVVVGISLVPHLEVPRARTASSNDRYRCHLRA